MIRYAGRLLAWWPLLMVFGLAACATPGGMPNPLGFQPFQAGPHLTPSPAAEAPVVLGIGSPIRLNEAVPVTITVHADRDMPKATISLVFAGNQPEIQGPSSWAIGNLNANQTVSVSSTIVFVSPGSYQMVGSFLDAGGRYSGNSVDIHVSAAGGVVNPTPWPAGTAAPVLPMPTEGTPYPSPTLMRTTPAEISTLLSGQPDVQIPVPVARSRMLTTGGV